MKFIHISDLHFHGHVSDNEDATSLLQSILKNENYKEHKLIVTGDIVDDGEETQFDRAFEALAPFLGRIYIAPGNHDFGAAGNFYSRERAERFDRKLSDPLKQGGTFTGDTTPVVNLLWDETDKVMLIALDTNLETPFAFDFACGQVGATQLAFLDNILGDLALADKTKILFFHHHPFIHGDPTMKLLDADALMRTIWNRVHVVCFGHRHFVNYWYNTNGIPHVTASNKSPERDKKKEWRAWEIDVTQKVITVTDIKIRQF